MGDGAGGRGRSVARPAGRRDSQRDDIIIDGGNSYYIDDIRRAEELQAEGLHYLDVGTSGGVWGAERGYCLMIGGDTEAVHAARPDLQDARAGRGDIARGRPAARRPAAQPKRAISTAARPGAGHFVKMVHNGIEYGLMAAYAEGLEHPAPRQRRQAEPQVNAETTPLRNPEHYQYDFDLPESPRSGGEAAWWPPGCWI